MRQEYYYFLHCRLKHLDLLEQSERALESRDVKLLQDMAEIYRVSVPDYFKSKDKYLWRLVDYYKAVKDYESLDLPYKEERIASFKETITTLEKLILGDSYNAEA
jgi:hypothetical protein